MKWAKLLRRGAALFFATMAVWWLAAGTDAGVAAERIFALDKPGQTQKAPGTMNVWERLILGQSPYLSASRVLAAPQPSPAATPEASQAPESIPTLPPLGAQDGETPLPESGSQDQNVIAQTFLPALDGSYLTADGVYLFNRTGQTVDMEAIAQSAVTLSGQGKGPQILIIHTHATEAYTQTDQDLYTESDSYRTTDDSHNVVRVGDEMAAAFAQAGLNVLHDRTLHDYPNYNGAYTRSYKTVKEYLAAYPSISIVLDVHRDALLGEDGSIYKTAADETILPNCAQVMLVVGTNETGIDHPAWRQNLALAVALERAVNEAAPTLARPIVLRSAAFNQQLSLGSLLVEVGTHGNTLQESITAARNFAQLSAPVIAQLLEQEQ